MENTKLREILKKHKSIILSTAECLYELCDINLYPELKECHEKYGKEFVKWKYEEMPVWFYKKEFEDINEIVIELRDLGKSSCHDISVILEVCCQHKEDKKYQGIADIFRPLLMKFYALQERLDGFQITEYGKLGV